MLLIFLMYFLFSISFQFGKNVLYSASPIFAVGIRFLFAGLILLLVYYFYDTKENHENAKTNWKKDLKLFFNVTFFGMYLAYTLRFLALGMMSPSKLSFFYNLSPFFSAIYCRIFFGETISKIQTLGLVVGIIGITPIIALQSPGEEGLAQIWSIGVYEILAFLAVAFHGYAWIGVRKLTCHHKYSVIFVNGITMLFAGIFAIITSISMSLFHSNGIAIEFLPKESFPLVQNMASFVALISIIILISNIICHNLYSYLLKFYTPTLLSLFSFLCPMFNIVIDYHFRGYPVTWHFGASAIIVFVGLWIFYNDERYKIIK